MTSLQTATKNHQTCPVMDGVTGPAAWAARINEHWRAAVEATFATGRDLIAAKATLKHGEWERMFTGHPKAVLKPLPFSVRTAEMLMAIARHPILSNAQHVSLLPRSWGTLYELTKVPQTVPERALDEGDVNSDMTREDAVALRPSPEVLPSVETNGDAGLPAAGLLATLPAVGAGEVDAYGEPPPLRHLDEEPKGRRMRRTRPESRLECVERLVRRLDDFITGTDDFIDSIDAIIDDIEASDWWFDSSVDVEVRTQQHELRARVADSAPHVDTLVQHLAALRKAIG
jgi:hypothetical protein